MGYWRRPLAPPTEELSPSINPEVRSPRHPGPLSSGATCNWQGTAGASSIALSWTSCEAVNISGIRCPNGTVRDIRLVSDSISGTVSGNSANGTGADSYNVFVSGTGGGVGVLVDNYSFTATR